jgi:23S rRNA pseudouridine1911/1915/1917 synthase
MVGDQLEGERLMVFGGGSAPAMADGATGWLPAALNGGWVYRDPIEASVASAVAFLAARHPHSSGEVWRERLAGGEILRNGVTLRQDTPLAPGDQLSWCRPPWWEGAVPGTWRVVHDDGDLHVIDKPAGLPVLPAGGWLEHTVLRLLERRHRHDPCGAPRPVHRLGRFTSGLLVCARQRATRRWLSARLRESTSALARDGGLAREGSRTEETGVPAAASGCQKVYQALLVRGGLPPELAAGEPLTIRTPIGRRPHDRLGWIWCAALEPHPGDLPALSTLTLLERGADSDRVEVAIASGRPHQIRIHCAAIGAPLLGDPLYGSGGLARPEALPGDGGYHLRAQRLALLAPDGSWLRLSVAPSPMPG